MHQLPALPSATDVSSSAHSDLEAVDPILPDPKQGRKNCGTGRGTKNWQNGAVAVGGEGHTLRDELVSVREQIDFLSRRVSELERVREEVTSLRSLVNRLVVERAQEQADRTSPSRHLHEEMQSLSEVIELLHKVLARLDPPENPRTGGSPDPVQKEFYSTEEFGQAIKNRRAEYTVRSWCNDGRINCSKKAPSRAWRIPASEIERYNREGLLPPKK